MEVQARLKERDILDQKLTELALLAKRLCPEAKVEVEEALAEKCNEILKESGLFILCASFDSQV